MPDGERDSVMTEIDSPRVHEVKGAKRGGKIHNGGPSGRKNRFVVVVWGVGKRTKEGEDGLVKGPYRRTQGRGG